MKIIKPKIEVSRIGARPLESWRWVLRDEAGKVLAYSFWHYISRLAGKRAAIKAKRLMAEAVIKVKR